MVVVEGELEALAGSEALVGPEVPEMRSVGGMLPTVCRSLGACWNWRERRMPR